MTDMKRQKHTGAGDGLGRVRPLFGEKLPQVMDELNRELVA